VESGFAGNNNQVYQHYLKEASTGISSKSEYLPSADYWGTAYTASRNSILWPSIIPAVAGANPTINWTASTPWSSPGYGEERFLVLLSDEFYGSIQDVAALSGLTSLGTAVPALTYQPGGSSAILIGASANPRRDTWSAASAGISIGVGAVAHAEDELYGGMTSGLAIAGSSGVTVLRSVAMLGDIPIEATASAEFDTPAFAFATIRVEGVAGCDTYRIFKVEQSLDVSTACGPIVL
jgi:hypothetical protein